jgi:hypothetical protein
MRYSIHLTEQTQRASAMLSSSGTQMQVEAEAVQVREGEEFLEKRSKRKGGIHKAA